MNTIVCKKVQYPRMDSEIQWEMSPKVLRDVMKVTPGYLEKFNKDGKPTGHQLLENKQATKKLKEDMDAQKLETEARRIREGALHKETLLAALGQGMAAQPTSSELEAAKAQAAQLAKLEADNKVLAAKLEAASKPEAKKDEQLTTENTKN